MNMKDFDLEKYPKNGSPFLVPKDYHENFSKDFLQNLDSHRKQPKVISLAGNLTLWNNTVAAILIIALMVTTYFIYNQPENLSSQELENYITYQSSISQDELLSLLSDDDILALTNDLYANNLWEYDTLLQETSVELLFENNEN